MVDAETVSFRSHFFALLTTRISNILNSTPPVSIDYHDLDTNYVLRVDKGFYESLYSCYMFLSLLVGNFENLFMNYLVVTILSVDFLQMVPIRVNSFLSSQFTLIVKERIGGQGRSKYPRIRSGPRLHTINKAC